MNAQDYTWFKDSPLGWSYCLTLVRGLDRAEALQRIGADPTEQVAGVIEFSRYAADNSSWHSDSKFVVGAVQLEGWTLLVEWNGFLGVTTEVIRPLSAGTRVVSHYRNVDAEDRFCWMENGDLRLRFEPLFPRHRNGSDPDGLVDVMEQVGFDLRDAEDRDY